MYKQTAIVLIYASLISTVAFATGTSSDTGATGSTDVTQEVQLGKVVAVKRTIPTDYETCKSHLKFFYVESRSDGRSLDHAECAFYSHSSDQSFLESFWMIEKPFMDVSTHAPCKITLGYHKMSSALSSPPSMDEPTDEVQFRFKFELTDASEDLSQSSFDSRINECITYAFSSDRYGSGISAIFLKVVP